MINDIHVIHIIAMYKINRRGGGGGVQKSFSRKLTDKNLVGLEKIIEL